MLNIEKEVDKILSERNFTPTVNELLKETLLLLDKTYQVITIQEKEFYIEEYIGVIKNLKGCAIIHLEELNEPWEVAEVFQKGIRKQKHGNLEYQNGLYIPRENGNYKVSFSGFTWNKERMIFLLDEHNPLNLLMTCYHELSHLQEGDYPFGISMDFPLRRWILQMCCEGRAASKEAKLKIDRPYYLEQIEDDSATFSIRAKNHYPLYALLYQILQFIFNQELWEKFSKNNCPTFDMLKVLKSNFPQIPVDKIFGYFLYLLSCYHHISKNILLAYLAKQSFNLTILCEIEKASLLEVFTFLEELVLETSQEDFKKLEKWEQLQNDYHLKSKKCFSHFIQDKNKQKTLSSF